DLVAERLLGRLAAEVVLVAEAVIGHRSDIDEAGAVRVGGAAKAGLAERGGGDPGAEQLVERPSTHCQSPCFPIPESQSSASGGPGHGLPQPAAWKGLPRQAGALRRILARSREMTTRTTIVAR